MNELLSKSAYILEQTRKINVFTTLFIIFLGLVGHSLTIFLFAQKKFRVNSSHVYMLSLAAFDGSFLILHLFEDTIRTFIDIYDANKLNSTHNSQIFTNILKLVNLTDNYEVTCQLINFLRYVFRSVSAYIIVAFTLQRVVLVCFPLNQRFKTKKSAWITVLLISLFSLPVNVWVFFFFEINKSEKNQYCDVKKSWKTNYFRITVIYISLIMLLPIITIFVCNALIIFKTIKADFNRKKMHLSNSSKNSVNSTKKSNIAIQKIEMSPRKLELICRQTSHLTVNQEIEALSSVQSSNCNLNMMPLQKSISNYRLKIYYQSNMNLISKNKLNNSTTITKTLIFISFTYAFLNLPYFTSWCIFFYEMAFKKIDHIGRNHLFTALQVSEIFYILNYSIYFYVNFIFGSVFRAHFKSASKRFYFY